ncbi:MAG TPA: WD40 repeat domain-containing protein, partial [Acidothermaceae bacterium]
GLWSSFAQGNAGRGQVELMVRGTDDTGTSVGASQSFHLQFSKDDIKGALYYWTTSAKTAIMRWDFGGSTKTAAQYLTPANTDGKTCVGCHALSLDGTKLVASAGGQNDGRLLLWNVSTNTPQQPFPLMHKSQFESWSADGGQFVGIYGDSNPNHTGPVNLMIFDGNTGAVTKTIDLGGLRADHPDWSKNTTGRNTIAFTSADSAAPTTDQRPATGGIDFIQLNGTTWSPPQVLVPAVLGKNHYYPAIAPDGNLVVYDESTCTNGTPMAGQAPDKSCDADTDMTATIFLTSLAGATPVALTNANSPGVADMGAVALTNSFPKWAPFIEQLDELHQVMWLTFSSTRQYGLRSPPPPANTSETTKGTLIWMVGMVLGPGGSDPSFTAFCLPFQDIATSNHIAQWAQTFVPIPIN